MAVIFETLNSEHLKIFYYNLTCDIKLFRIFRMLVLLSEKIVLIESFFDISNSPVLEPGRMIEFYINMLDSIFFIFPDFTMLFHRLPVLLLH